MKKQVLFFFLFCFYMSFSQENSFFNIVRKGTIEEAQFYIKSNSNCVNKVNEHGFSPLILACYNGNDQMVIFLLENNADLNYISPEGTVLMAATVKGNEQMVEFFLKRKANPDLTNQSGVTALMYAIQFKNIKIIELLLKYNANKSLVDDEGKTAFEYAVFSKSDEIINLLK